MPRWLGRRPLTRQAAGVADVVPVRIGADVVGLVAALGDEPFAGEQRAWLEAAANAAAVDALMRESHGTDLESAQRTFVLAVAARPPSDVGALIASARRLGFDLRPGAIAICATPDDGTLDPSWPTRSAPTTRAAACSALLPRRPRRPRPRRRCFGLEAG